MNLTSEVRTDLNYIFSASWYYWITLEDVCTYNGSNMSILTVSHYDVTTNDRINI